MSALYDELIGLAHERAAGRRAVLLHRLTDLFFRGVGRHNDGVVQLFEDVLCRVLSEVEIRARIELSDRVAYSPHVPHGVVLRLAEDEIPVAAPVLRHSPALTDDDLSDIATRRTPAHRGAMARRIFLAETVTDTLLAFTDGEVHRALAGNDGAQFTASGYENLLREAASDSVLQELLALRPGIPAPVNERLMAFVADDVRRRVVARRAERAAPVRMQGLEPALDEPFDAMESVDLQVAVESGVLTLDEALQRACTRARHDWVVDLVAASGKIERHQLMQALLARDPRPLAVVFKAQGLDADTFRAALEMRAKALGIGSNDPRHVMDYRQLDARLARTVLRQRTEAAAAG